MHGGKSQVCQHLSNCFPLLRARRVTSSWALSCSGWGPETPHCQIQQRLTHLLGLAPALEEAQSSLDTRRHRSWSLSVFLHLLAHLCASHSGDLWLCHPPTARRTWTLRTGSRASKLMQGKLTPLSPQGPLLQTALSPPALEDTQR